MMKLLFAHVRAATFLQYHCIDFFTNVDELALTLGSLSDADLFVAREVGLYRYTNLPPPPYHARHLLFAFGSP